MWYYVVHWMNQIDLWDHSDQSAWADHTQEHARRLQELLGRGFRSNRLDSADASSLAEAWRWGFLFVKAQHFLGGARQEQTGTLSSRELQKIHHVHVILLRRVHHDNEVAKVTRPRLHHVQVWWDAKKAGRWIASTKRSHQPGHIHRLWRWLYHYWRCLQESPLAEEVWRIGQ